MGMHFILKLLSSWVFSVFAVEVFFHSWDTISWKKNTLGISKILVKYYEV